MKSEKSFVDTVIDTITETVKHLGENDDHQGVSDIIVGGDTVLDLRRVKTFNVSIGSQK